MKRKIILSILLVLGLIGLGYIEYSYDDSDYYDMTCESYKKESITALMLADNDVAAKIRRTWERASRKIRIDYPEHKYTQEDSPQSVFIIMQSCNPHLFTETDKVGPSLEEILRRIVIKDIRQEQANKKGCYIHEAYQAAEFDIEDETKYISFCTPENYSSKTLKLIQSEIDGPPIAAEICSHKNSEKCYRLMPTDENFCLSQFGLCAKDEKNICGWISTEKSEACTADTTMLQK